MKTSGRSVCGVAVAALTLLYIPTSLPGAQAVSQTDLYNLFNHLFGVYQKEILPVDNNTSVVHVFLSFKLLSLVDVNEKDQTLVSNALLEMSWLDLTLTWNPLLYGNASSFLVHQENIWRPDVQVGNSVVKQKQLGFDELPVRVESNGYVFWEPTTVMSTSCDIDVTYYPMDTQVCNIDFQTSLSRSDEIDISIDKLIPISLEDYNTDGQWDLVDTNSENLSNENDKTKIRFSLLLKRRRTYYVVNILLPVVFLSFTSTLVFALPAEAGEKMSMGITVLLAYAVYLTIISDQMPNTSVQTSIMAVYLTTLLGITAVGIMVSTFILRLHHRSAGRRVDDQTQKLVEILKIITFSVTEEDRQVPKNSISPEEPMLHDKRYKNFQVSPSYLNAIDTTRGKTTSVKGKHRASDQDSNSGNLDSKFERGQTNIGMNRPISCPPVYQKPMTWQEVAEVADWFLFILFTAITSVLTLTILILLPVGGDARAPTLNKTDLNTLY